MLWWQGKGRLLTLPTEPSHNGSASRYKITLNLFVQSSSAFIEDEELREQRKCEQQWNSTKSTVTYLQIILITIFTFYVRFYLTHPSPTQTFIVCNSHNYIFLFLIPLLLTLNINLDKWWLREVVDYRPVLNSRSHHQWECEVFDANVVLIRWVTAFNKELYN